MKPPLGRTLSSDAPLAQLLPPYVWVKDSVESLDEPLFPGEEVAVLDAFPARRAEFRTGRALARRALRAAGVRPQAILTGPRGAPQWPTGLVGSITHCAGYCAAVLARTDRLAGIGVDAERRTVLTLAETGVVTTALERQRALETHLPPEWSLHAFCAKEAAFKSVPAGLEQPTDPTDIEVNLDYQTGAFTATIADRLVRGRWGTTDSHVFAAAVSRW